MATKKEDEIGKLKISPAKEIKILRKIVEVTNSELDLQWILKEVVSIVNDISKSDSVFIYLYNEKARHFVLMSSKTPHKRELGQVSLKSGEGITGWVAKQKKPVAIKKNAYQDHRFKHFDVLPEDRYEAFLSVPITHKKKVIGVINVQHKKAHDFSDSLINLITLIAMQMSGAIMNAQLYEEMKKKAVQFDSLVKVSHSITSQGYLDEILNLIVVVTAEMLNSKICSIMLLDKKGNELVIKATQSLSEAYKKKPNLKVASSISGEVVRTKESIAIYDVRKEKGYHFRDLAVKESLCSMLAVPMVVRDKAIGIINIYTEETHEFIKEEIDVLQMVANQAAIAVENTHLMDAALKAKEALETRKIIERAKGVLVSMANLSEDDAYRLIHKKSMDSCRSMKEIAESILLMDDLQKSK
ncbi:MAG: GAF domain-containing protein [Candidatus Omnitrophica bacterium]|nr:GAF domain-containing protein [Candidatus Omnitrophota bacterium]